MDVTVTKTGTTLVPASVRWTTADGTASHPGDYTAQSGYLEFAAGDTTKTITIDLVDDNTAESAETFKVQLDGTLAVDARVGGTAETTITVNDDDGTGVPVSVTMSASDGDSDGNAVEGAGGATGYRTVTITLGRALSGSEEVTVPLSVAGATVATDYTFGLQPSTQSGVTLSTSGPHSAQDPAVVFASGASSATLRLTPVDNNVRSQPYVIVDYGTGARAPSAAGGAVLGVPAGGPVGVVLVDDESGDIVLPAGSSLRPGQVDAGGEYRVLFMTSVGGPASSSDIAVYDHFVRSLAVANGGADMLPYAGFFKAFVSTASTAGRIHVGIWDPSLGGGSGGYADGTTGSVAAGTSIHWLGTSSDQVMTSYWNFCRRNTWFNRWSATENSLRHEDGSVGDGAKVWTGMTNTCTSSSSPLGSATPTYGPGAQAGAPLSLGTEAASNSNRFYAVSEVFKAETSAAIPRVSFSHSSFSGNEDSDHTMPPSASNRPAVLTVQAAPAPAEDLTVSYTLTANDATAGVDFIAAAGSVTIPAGQSSASFAVEFVDDDVFEESETFRVLLTPSPGYVFGGPTMPRTAVVTITDDDDVEVGFEHAEYWALEDGGNFDVNLTLSHETDLAVNLTLSVGGTATAGGGGDYTAPQTSVTIPAGNTSGTHTVTIPITADTTVEADETITLRISAVTTPRAAMAARDRATVFIADQDRTTPGLVAPGTVAVREGESATYRLRLATAPSGAVTVSVSGQSLGELTLDADDATNGDQASVQFTTSNWYVGRRVTVRGVHDADLTDDTVSLSHSASGGGYGSVTGSVSATVDDEDVELSITGGAAVTEGTAAEFTVTAATAPDRDLTVELTITDATGADFVAAGDEGNRTRVLAAGQASATFMVATVADSTAERSGPITIALRTSDHYSIDSSAASAEVQVNDDDSTRLIVDMAASDGDTAGNAVEGASNATGYRTITITLGRALTSGESVTVPLTVVGATVTTDYTFALQPPSQTGVSLNTSGTHSAQDPAVVFASGASSATLRLTPVNNSAPTEPYVIVDYGTGSRAPSASGAGLTLADPTGGPFGFVLVDDDGGDIEVAADWALAPAGLSAGDEFRLMFITSESRTAESTDIGVYNEWVQALVAVGGHTALKPYGGLVRVVASTTSVDARVNTAMWDPTLNSNAGAWVDSSTSASDSGVKVYWLAAPPTSKVADNYFDFYDNSWEGGNNQNARDTVESGASRTSGGGFWTGSNNDGTASSSHELGASNPTLSNVGSGNRLNDAQVTRTAQRTLLVMSPVFKMLAATTGPEVSVRLMTGEGENRNPNGEVERLEVDGTVTFPLSLDAQPAADLTVCVNVVESGPVDRVAAGDEGIKTVTFMSGVQSGSIDVAWSDNSADDLDSVITVTAVPSSTAGCSSSGTYTVSTSNGSDKVRITDDEVTQLTLGSSDTEMGEGDASNTAILTVSAGRALVAGESVVATITLTSGTGARLPGHGTPDFAVSASGTGVALTNAGSATPRVTFTGADGATVQTATVTLTPVAAADDGDTSDEEITATLSVVAGTGSGTVVTGGGVEVTSASSTQDLTIDDDEAAACTAQNSVLSVSDLRITENGGVTTYCVRLATAPSSGQTTTVTIGEAAGQPVFRPSTFTVIQSVSSGAATISPSTLMFTASNYTEPQEVTVTAIDEANTNRNRRFNLTHTANGGGYSNQSLGGFPVLVTDAPELEVFEYRRTYDEAAYNAHKRANGGWGIFRPNTLTSTPGLGPAPDITPGEVLDYYVRLSAQPAGEVTVTIDVEQIADYVPTTFTGISFTRGGAPQQTLTFTFHDGDPTNAGCADGRKGGDRYTETRISWKCYRAIWVHNTRNSLNEEGTRCANVVHDGEGGGFRAATVDTIRAFSVGRVFGNSPKEHLIGQYWDLNSESFYRLIYFSRKNQSVPYTWHMRPWSGGSLVTADTLNLEMEYVSTGQFDWPADCPLLRRKYAAQHTPQNSPQNDPGPLPVQAPPAPPAPTAAVANLTLTAAGTSVEVAWDAVPDATKYLVAYSAEAADGQAQSAGVFDGVTATSYTFDHGITAPATVTVTVTPGHDTAGGTTAVYLDDLAATATVNTQPAAQATTPEVTVTAGGDVAEGTDATFTVTATPAPQAALTVTVEITQTGDYATTTGTQTVTIPTGGAYTLTVATTDDSTDEADGTVTATVDTGVGYTVSTTAAAASVAVSDNDPPPDCVSDRTLGRARDYYDLNRNRAPGYGKNWRRVLIAFGDVTDNLIEPFTAAEARQSETRWTGWRPFREALECIEKARQDPTPPPADPEISITAGTDVTEGTDATFTITATPTPAADLTVTVEITQTGDHATTTGTQTVTIPTTGSYTLTIPTTDEADGAITATVNTGTGYTISTTNSDATVNVADDDTPEITITAGSSVTEGTDATFTLTAAPTPHAALDVTVTISQTGDHATTGTQTVTIPTTGTYTLTVATTNDNINEPDGTITATVDTGTGYTVSTSNSDATVNVADDDTPEITITAGSSVTEGTDATFTLTAAPTPHAALTVTVAVSQTGDHAATGTQTVTVPTSGTHTLTIPTTDDNTDEPDGTITATINTGTGYTISSSNSAATVAVADNDDPEPEPEPDPEPDTETDTETETCAPELPADAVTAAEVTGWRDGLTNAAGIKRFNRVLAALGEDTSETPMTAEQAQEVADWLNNTRWDRIARTLGALEQAQCQDPDPDTEQTDDNNNDDDDDNDDDPAPSGPPVVTINDATATEGDPQGLRFVVEVTPASDQTITLGYGVFDRPAIQDQDFTAPYQQFTLNPGENRLEIVLPIIDDNTTEPDETLNLFIYATSGITIPNYFLYATGTIKDND